MSRGGLRSAMAGGHFAPGARTVLEAVRTAGKPQMDI